MILMQASTHDLYLHQARQFDQNPGYVLLYGLEVTWYQDRRAAVRRFAQCLDHAEECETGLCPIYGDDK